ncbi:hypothetical protein [Mangrovibacterium sp.]|uniref:hypothetical protein n=1 Tax=Mangrovibacterium sp. TaxID=1961364 RepID=UPI003564C351
MKNLVLTLAALVVCEIASAQFGGIQRVPQADFSTIAGEIVPGLLLIKPDFFENKDDWPFLWGENEVTIGGSAEYIVLSNAILDLVKE